MKGFTKTERAEREPHRGYRFVVSDGATRFRTHCPVCLAQNDGWWEGGEPRYSGGVIHVKQFDVSGRSVDLVAACRCFVGQARRERRNLPLSIDELPPNVEFVTTPAAILWKDGDSTGPPPAEGPENVEHEAESRLAFAKQFRRFESGRLSLEQLGANVDALRKKYTPDLVVVPTVEAIIRDRALRDLYFGTTVRRRSTPKENEKLPYRDD